METINSDNRLKKIMASINTKTMPEIIKLNPEERFELSNKGYIIPLDDLIEFHRAQRFRSRQPRQAGTGGHNYDIPYTLGNYGTLWYRTDLLDQAGVKPPRTWDEMSAAAAKLTTGGKFGFAYPAGNNRQTASYLGQLIWSAGGTFFDKDLNVSFDNPGTVKALQLLRDLAKSSPPGIGTYSTGEMSNAFSTEQVAMEQYAARVIQVMIDLKPDLVQKIGAVARVVGPTGMAVKYVGTNSFAISSPDFGAAHTEAAKKFLRFLFQRQQMVDLSLTAFPHFVPPLLQRAAGSAGKGRRQGRRPDGDRTGSPSMDTANGLDLRIGSRCHLLRRESDLAASRVIQSLYRRHRVPERLLFHRGPKRSSWTEWTRARRRRNGERPRNEQGSRGHQVAGRGVGGRGGEWTAVRLRPRFRPAS